MNKWGITIYDRKRRHKLVCDRTIEIQPGTALDDSEARPFGCGDLVVTEQFGQEMPEVWVSLFNWADNHFRGYVETALATKACPPFNENRYDWICLSSVSDHFQKDWGPFVAMLQEWR